MPTTYPVKNKLVVALHLFDAAGDSTQVPPLSTHEVEARFIEFQLPPLSHAEVLGFDYAAHLAPKTVAAPEPAPAPSPSSGKSARADD
jgi:hypothetical protein